MFSAKAVESYDSLEVRGRTSRNFHGDANVARLTELERAQVDELTPTLVTFVEFSKDSSSEGSATLGDESQGSSVRVGTEHVSSTVDEVGSNNQTVRNKAESSISFYGNI